MEIERVRATSPRRATATRALRVHHLAMVPGAAAPATVRQSPVIAREGSLDMSYDFRGAFKRTPATLTLVIVNVVVFLIAQVLTGPAYRLYSYQALSVITIEAGWWWTLVTSMFMHGSVMHILFNMFSLYWLGLTMERVLGSAKFLVTYFASGIAGGLTYLAWCYLSGSVGWAIGASGAIFGLFGAYGVMLLVESRRPMFLNQASARQSLTQFLVLLAVNVLYGFTGGIAWQAHLGGLVVGAILGYVFYLQLRRTRGMGRFGAR